MDYFKILIVEDEVLIAEFIKDLLEESGFTQLQIANDVATAQELMHDFRPDIILMDINLKDEISGIELSLQKPDDASIVFLTGQSELSTIQKAIQTQPAGYLTKPIKKTDLLALILLLKQEKENDFLSIKNGYEILKLRKNTILYVKSDNVYLDIYTQHKKYTIRMTLERLLKELNSSYFIKVHRSYLVNSNSITKQTSKSIFINEIEIPVSRKANITL